MFNDEDSQRHQFDYQDIDGDGAAGDEDECQEKICDNCEGDINDRLL